MPKFARVRPLGNTFVPARASARARLLPWRAQSFPALCPASRTDRLGPLAAESETQARGTAHSSGQSSLDRGRGGGTGDLDGFGAARRPAQDERAFEPVE